MRTRNFWIAVVGLAFVMSVGCVDKGVQSDFKKLIVGDWELTELRQGANTYTEIPSEVLFQFTSDRQIVVKMNGNRDKAKYYLKENMIIVDDGVITNITEKIKIDALNKKELVITFKMDGEVALMKFRRKVN